jgi:RNA polymerase sigma factor (sigma-70 family)
MEPPSVIVPLTPNVPASVLSGTRIKESSSGKVGRSRGAADPGPSANPQSWLEQVEVIEAIERLPDELREVVDLYVIQDLPRAEVAELTGVSERQVNRRWIRARLALAEGLGDAS